MSLLTLIEIGNKIRHQLSKDKSLQYHRFIKKAPLYTSKQPYTYYQFNVNSNFEVVIESLQEIEDENIIKNKFYYLKFKTGEADSLVKYMFGDIAYPEFFKLDDSSNGAAAFRLNSFLRGKEDAKKIPNEKLKSFRLSLERNLETLLNLFKENEYCYIHFNFSGKCWYETEVFNDVENGLVANFIKEENGNISLFEYLTRTLAGKEKFERMIDFDVQNNFKSKCFANIEEVKDLLYGLDFQQNYKVRNSGGEIVINVLPKGNISAKGIIEFFEKKSNYDFNNQKPESIDPFAEPFVNPEIDGIEKYDIIFSRPIKFSKPIGSDLLEIADINQNLLQRVTKKIAKTKTELGYRFTIDFAIKVLLDDKKYTSHLLKILPLIYKDNYYSDDILLPALIQKTEFTIRNGDGKKNYFNGLKQHFYFLTKLQINNTIMEIKNTHSYLMGTKLGIMAKPVAYSIKSFEKAYVGNLSRRIASLNDVIEFSNYLNEKLMIHEKGYPSVKEAARELVKIIDYFSTDEKYNRHYCALGFFESYYSYTKGYDTQEDEELAIVNK